MSDWAKQAAEQIFREIPDVMRPWEKKDDYIESWAETIRHVHAQHRPEAPRYAHVSPGRVVDVAPGPFAIDIDKAE